MEQINNKTDNLFREIRSIKIYKSSDYSFIDNLLKEEINAEAILEINNIVPEDYDRSIKPKKSGGNKFYEIDVTFSLYSIDHEDVERWNNLLNKQDFVVVFYSNEEITIVGNHLEPMAVDVIDGIKENNSGQDAIHINIHGKTIIYPWIKKI